MTKWIGYHYRDIIVAFNSFLPSEYRYLLYQILTNKEMSFCIKHTRVFGQIWNSNEWIKMGAS